VVIYFKFSTTFFPRVSVKFFTDGHTVGRKWLTGCGDSASWFYFMGVCILITCNLVLVAMITTFL